MLPCSETQDSFPTARRHRRPLQPASSSLSGSPRLQCTRDQPNRPANTHRSPKTAIWLHFTAVSVADTWICNDGASGPEARSVTFTNQIFRAKEMGGSSDEIITTRGCDRRILLKESALSVTRNACAREITNGIT